MLLVYFIDFIEHSVYYVYVLLVW